MSTVSFFIKIVGEKAEREIEVPATHTLRQIFSIVADVLVLPVESFKILKGGRPLKNDSSSLEDGNISNDDKLTVMITEKIDVADLNDFEKAAYNRTTDPKRKQLAVLRLRKVLAKFSKRLSLDDLSRELLQDEHVEPKLRFKEEEILRLVDKSVINV